MNYKISVLDLQIMSMGDVKKEESLLNVCLPVRLIKLPCSCTQPCTCQGFLLVIK